MVHVLYGQVHGDVLIIIHRKSRKDEPPIFSHNFVKACTVQAKFVSDQPLLYQENLEILTENLL